MFFMILLVPVLCDQLDNDWHTASTSKKKCLYWTCAMFGNLSALPRLDFAVPQICMVLGMVHYLEVQKQA